MTAPLRIAKIANARARISELIAGRCTFPDEVAREVVDELLNLGWTFPGWRVDDDVPQPSSSTPEGRRRARELFAEARRAALSPITHVTLTDAERAAFGCDCERHPIDTDTCAALSAAERQKGRRE